MSIELKSSEKMSERKDMFQEDLMIRLPMFLRQKFALSIGDLLSFTGKDGKLVNLLIDRAFRSDAEANETVGYITNNTLSKLDIAKSNVHIPIVNNITIGADPELFLVDRSDGILATATSFFPKNGPIGYDGMLAEIRPIPSVDTDVVTNNIYNLLSEARRIISAANDPRSIVLYGGSQYNGLTAGFHVHFGLPDQILAGNNDRKILHAQIAKILDYYVGIPCMIAEGADSARRCAPFISYGKVSDHRVDGTTFEYRVPGGNLLRHPILTRGLLTLSALVMEDIVSRVRVLTDNFVNIRKLCRQEDVNSLYANVPTIEELFGTICVPYVDAANVQLVKIKEDLSNMLGFAGRKDVIDEFLNNLETDFSHVIDDNWHLPVNKVSTMAR